MFLVSLLMLEKTSKLNLKAGQCWPKKWKAEKIRTLLYIYHTKLCNLSKSTTQASYCCREVALHFLFEILELIIVTVCSNVWHSVEVGIGIVVFLDRK